MYSFISLNSQRGERKGLAALRAKLSEGACIDSDTSEKSSNWSGASRKRRIKKVLPPAESSSDEADDCAHKVYETVQLNKLPGSLAELRKLDAELGASIDTAKRSFFIDARQTRGQAGSDLPTNAIPISADVREFNFGHLAATQQRLTGRLFDVVMLDPPWQLSTSQPSRGVVIAYDSLADESILNLPLPVIQSAGFLFIWVINAKYSVTCQAMHRWGYRLIDEIVWIKKTVTGKIAKGHGFYLQHAKETCLVGVKNPSQCPHSPNVCSNVIFSERRGQSQKPNEIYELIEELVPNGFYLEIFGRRNNLRDNWVTLGNEL